MVNSRPALPANLERMMSYDLGALSPPASTSTPRCRRDTEVPFPAVRRPRTDAAGKGCLQYGGPPHADIRFVAPSDVQKGGRWFGRGLAGRGGGIEPAARGLFPIGANTACNATTAHRHCAPAIPALEAAGAWALCRSRARSVVARARARARCCRRGGGLSNADRHRGIPPAWPVHESPVSVGRSPSVPRRDGRRHGKTSTSAQSQIW